MHAILCTTATYFDFHVPGLEVQSDLQLEMFHNGGEYLHPVLLQRSEAMWRHRHSTKLWLPTLETDTSILELLNRNKYCRRKSPHHTVLVSTGLISTS